MSSKPLYSIGNSCYEDRALMVAPPKIRTKNKGNKYWQKILVKNTGKKYWQKILAAKNFEKRDRQHE